MSDVRCWCVIERAQMQTILQNGALWFAIEQTTQAFNGSLVAYKTMGLVTRLSDYQAANAPVIAVEAPDEETMRHLEKTCFEKDVPHYRAKDDSGVLGVKNAGTFLVIGPCRRMHLPKKILTLPLLQWLAIMAHDDCK